MTADEVPRLPPSVGGLIDFAAAAYLQRFPLYAALGIGVFAACAIPEFLWRASGPELGVKTIVVSLLDLFADAFVVAVLAIGTAARVAEGEPRPAGSIVRLALERWLPVLGALLIAQLCVALSLSAGGIGPVEDPLVTAFTAPVIWLFWGALGLVGPIAALSAEHPGVAIFVALGRALSMSFRAVNLGRLCVVAFASVAPLLLQNVLADVLHRRGVAHLDFWANIPIDALTIGPIAALQTVFALDFARRGPPR